jgi:alpha-galactosidase
MPESLAVTVIGAASTTFGPKLIRDVLNHDAFEGCELRFVDVNEERLRTYERLAALVFAKAGRHVTIRATTDRTEALPGSRYVIVSVDRGHFHTWRQDFEIPNRLGMRQVQGELGGPGGLFHSLRQIPPHLEFAADIGRLCPDAMVLVCSNPLNRICLAMQRYGGLDNVVGLCHGAEMAIYLLLPRHMGIPGDDMEITAAGTNHLTWTLGLRHKRTGEDLLPLMREALAGMPPGEQPLSRKFLDVFGYFPATLDSHFGEYIQFAHDLAGTAGPDFDNSLDQEAKRWEYFDLLVRGEVDFGTYEQRYGEQVATSEELRLAEFCQPRSWADTLAAPIINALEGNVPVRMPAVNMVNEGAIANLPDGCFVETPAYADPSGVRPLAVGALPEGLAAFNVRDIQQTDAIVDAAVSGERRMVLRAMLLDPTVDSVRAAEAILDEMLRTQAEYLPEFD